MLDDDDDGSSNNNLLLLKRARCEEECPARMIRAEAVLRARTGRIMVCLDRVCDKHNIAAALRTAEAMGVQHVWSVAGTLGEKLRGRRPRDIAAIGKGADAWLSLRSFETPGECVAALRAENWTIWVAADDEDALSLASSRRESRRRWDAATSATQGPTTWEATGSSRSSLGANPTASAPSSRRPPSAESACRSAGSPPPSTSPWRRRSLSSGSSIGFLTSAATSRRTRKLRSASLGAITSRRTPRPGNDSPLGSSTPSSSPHMRRRTTETRGFRRGPGRREECASARPPFSRARPPPHNSRRVRRRRRRSVFYTSYPRQGGENMAIAYPDPPAWWDAVTSATPPPPIPPNSQNWRSFGSEDLDEEFWTEDASESMATKWAALKAMNRELVLTFAAILQEAAAAERNMDVEPLMREVEAQFSAIHKKLGRLRIYEGRRHLMRKYRHQIAERREAAARLRRQTENALKEIDDMLRAAPPDLDPPPFADDEEEDEEESSDEDDPEEELLWLDGTNRPEDLNWIFKRLGKEFRGWKIRTRPMTEEDDLPSSPPPSPSPAERE